MATGIRQGRAMVLVAAAAAVGLLLAGCGSSGSAKSGSDSSGAKSTSKVSVAYSSPGASYSDLYLAESQGIFAKNGLAVDLRTLNSSSQIIPAVLSGSVDIAVGSATDAAAAIMQGSDLKWIALTRPVFNLQVYAEKSLSSVQDLKGKKVGLTSPGSQSDQALTAMLQKNGMSRSDVTPTYVKSIPGELAALESGSVAAIIAQPPQGKEVIDKGYKVLADLTSIPFASAGVVVTGDFLKQHPDIVDKFVKSEVQSLAMLQKNKAATVKAIVKYSGDPKEADATYAYDFFKKVWVTDPTVDSDLITQAFQIEADATKGTVPSDVSKYIDNSFVKKYAGSASSS